MAIRDLLDEPGDGGLVGHVADVPTGAAGAQGRDGLPPSRGLAADHRGNRAFGRRRLGDGAADPAVAAGDQDHPPVELQIHPLRPDTLPMRAHEQGAGADGKCDGRMMKAPPLATRGRPQRKRRIPRNVSAWRRGQAATTPRLSRRRDCVKGELRAPIPWAGPSSDAPPQMRLRPTMACQISSTTMAPIAATTML